MRLTHAVFAKELVDHVRDVRSVASALLFPILGPVLFAVMMTVMASWADASGPVNVALVGGDDAPHLIEFLSRHGLETEPAPADYEAQVTAGALDAVLVVPDDYAERYQQGRPARVDLLFDQSRRNSASKVHRVRSVLEAWSRATGSQRLLARGVHPELAYALDIRPIDLATPEKLAAMMLNMVPLFLVLAAFVGGMNVAIDTTAGERERGSLEPLLSNPAPRGSIVAGKWLATVAVAGAAVLLSLAGYVVAIKYAPIAQLGVRASTGPAEVVFLLATLLPLTLFASALQMLVATYARSFKEAQTYLSLLLFLPMLPGLVLTFSPVDAQAYWYAVPALGQHLLIQDIIGGAPVPATAWALSLLGLGVPAAMCLVGCTRLLQNERIIFARG